MGERWVNIQMLVASYQGYLRDLQPKQPFIWDVQCVIDYIKSNLSDNDNLSDKVLTLKVTMLMALTSASRSLGLHHLDTNFISRTHNCVEFTYGQLHKSWKKGPPSISFVEFPQD